MTDAGPYLSNCWRIGYFEAMYFLRQNMRSCIVVSNGTINRHCSSLAKLLATVSAEEKRERAKKSPKRSITAIDVIS